MLTLDVLYAVLQGLPSDRLAHLENTSWLVFCRDIERFLSQGIGPLDALKMALKRANEWQRQHLRKALQEVLPVMSIPRLTYRQKQALIALRYAKTASLTELSCTLMADRSNTRRRMQALVRRGFAIQFSQPGGLCYLAVSIPLSKEVKLGVQDILDQLIEEFAAQPT